MDGGWSDFGPWMCLYCHSTINCVITRRRYCNNPEPQNGGKYCNGRGVEFKDVIVESHNCYHYVHILADAVD